MKRASYGVVSRDIEPTSIAATWNVEAHHRPADFQALVREFLLATRLLDDEDIVRIAGIHPTLLTKWRFGLIGRMRKEQQRRLIQYLASQKGWRA